MQNDLKALVAEMLSFYPSSDAIDQITADDKTIERPLPIIGKGPTDRQVMRWIAIWKSSEAE